MTGYKNIWLMFWHHFCGFTVDVLVAHVALTSRHAFHLWHYKMYTIL